LTSGDKMGMDLTWIWFGCVLGLPWIWFGFALDLVGTPPPPCQAINGLIWGEFSPSFLRRRLRRTSDPLVNISGAYG
jgi:hypothetical protein